MQQNTTRRKATAKKASLNPTYVKIGKRIRQARRMAQESNSRALSERLGWGAGRLNNFELGISTPGPDETELLGEVLRVEPAWITYGVGSPRAATLDTTRHRNFMGVLDEAERAGELPALLDAVRLTVERLEKLRANPFKKIPDLMARRCEKHLNKPRGWLDETRIEADYCEPLPADMRELLQVYVGLCEGDRRKFYEMGRVLLGDGSARDTGKDASR